MSATQTNADMTEILASDVVSNALVTNLMGFGTDPAIVGGFAISDVMYEMALKEWAEDNYGGVGGGLEDALARDVVLKSIVSTVAIWGTSRVAGQNIGAVSAAINAVASYMTSNGILQLLQVAR
jgi:hypothetical protein